MASFWHYLELVLFVFNLMILFYFLCLNLYYIFLSALSTIQLINFRKRRMSRHRNVKGSPILPSVSILSPAYNEEVTIVESVNSLLKVDYPKLEIIVINDGSKDGTLDALKKGFKLKLAKRKPSGRLETKEIRDVYRSRTHTNLLVVDKENGGKADALNVGINFSRSKLVCAIDADSLLEKNALQRMVEEYLTEGKEVIALGGMIRIANGCTIKDGEVTEIRMPRKMLPALQVVEYIRAFLCGRSGFNLINALLIISGAFGLFDRRIVIEAGGYNHKTVGEDMELVVRMHRYMRKKKRPYKIIFVPDPVCWTQAPDELKILSRQRNRWQRGLIESLLMNREMAFNPRYGAAGMLSYPFFLIFEGIGPLFEVFGYFMVIVSVLMGWINIGFFLVFLFLAVVLGIILSMFALILEEISVKKYIDENDITRMIALAVVENLGFRQLITYWRLRGLIDLMKRKRSWGTMVRKKF
ncbi:MAG: glycosyltransferase [Candidatus Thermoplasmatota archaeon]|nr:glycosyltransferase [Candidatus Thermoplasmatota archaeon]